MHGWWECKIPQPFWKTVWHFRTQWHIYSPWSISRTPWYLPKGAKNVCPHNNLHKDAYGSFVPKCPDREATMTPFSRKADKQWATQIMEYYVALKRKELSSQEKTVSKLKRILLSERSHSGKATHWVIPTAGIPHFTALHFIVLCKRFIFFTNWRQEPPPAKWSQLALLWNSLCYSGLEVKPQYL